MTFLKPLRLLGLLALAIIVLIHLKNRKLKEVQVPSIKLWDKVFGEINKVSKKRINKYILLFLHLLIGVFIILAFAEPNLILKNKNNLYTLAIDCSMSMNAMENGKTHMDVLKEEVKKFTDSLPKNYRYNLILMKDYSEVIKENVNKNEIIKELSKVKPVKEPLDVEKGSKIINSFKKNVVIFTNKEVFTGNKIIKIGSKLNDIGIIYGNYYKDSHKCYCIVKNYGEQKKEVNLTLKDDKGNILGANNCTLNVGEEKKVSFHYVLKNIKALNFYIDNKDMIYENNYYSISIDESSKKKVVMLGENYFIERAISILPYVEFSKKENLDFNKDKFDLYIICKKDINDVPEKCNVWWVESPKNMLGKNVVKGEISIKDSRMVGGINEIKSYGQGNEIVNKDEKLREIMKINNKLVMCSDKNNKLYSSLDWTKCDMVLTPAFPVLVDNVLDNLLFKDKKNYEYKDYVINNQQDLNTAKTFSNNLMNLNLKNVFVIIILIILIVEWQVFKNEY
ncbi:vWA domain-containing protein [Clostridium lundense]|uniref:vWA domain-containing protein n=1 Tax=Clostridium lundense TaxID=319475 RepID=UPI000489B8DC|nr:BatA and WFA domain-containing protein [Clostridium lundense]